jgi:hypothetical protein
MNKHCIQLFPLALACLCLAACPQEPEEKPGITVTLYVYGNEEPRYWSLATGEEVTDPGAIKSQAWDIAFHTHDSTFFILTNSGITAASLGSGGKGAVWYTDHTNFDSAVLADAVTNPPEEYQPYTQDVERWAMVMGAEAVRETLNIMTYLGYPGSDSPEHNGMTEATYFQRRDPLRTGGGAMDPSYMPYEFNKKQFYEMRGMPPTYTPNYQVYVIRHGDGLGYSKLQVPDGYLEYNAAKPEEAFFVLRIIHEQLSN